MSTRICTIAALVALTSACAPKDDPLDVIADFTAADESAILVVRPDSPTMTEVMEGLEDEVDGDYQFVNMPFSRKVTEEVLSEAIATIKPKAVLLMDNPTVALYENYQASHADAPPGVAVMSLFLEEKAAKSEGLTGIAYEVPAVTSFVNLRNVIDAPLVKVGVLHRPRFGSFVSRQGELAAMEGFELVAVELSERPGPGEVKRKLSKLRASVDALWVLNDNGLLTTDILVDAWMPEMRKNKLPVIVGVDSLVDTPTPFGTFAVLPDHSGLGMQAAELFYELEDEDWQADAVPTQLPIAVQTVLKVSFAREHLGLIEAKIDTLDRLIE